MADDKALDEASLKRLREWLSEKWQKGCPFCEQNSWVASHVITLISQRPDELGTISLGGTTFPCVVVTCQNCGNTALVNALSSGVLLKEDGDHGE